jgi:formamidopyrimidine-DNA glycosylase
MPEGPEVKTIVDALNERLKGKLISEIHFLESGKYGKKAPDHTLELIHDLPLFIKKVGCRGKFIYFSLKEKNGKRYYLGNGLGMSGKWSFKNSDDLPPKHAAVMLKIKGMRPLYFVDHRHLGNFYIYPTKSKFLEKIDSLGPDFLNDNVSFEVFSKRIATHPRMSINNLLMDQCIISGVGNYIKSEVLYLARISPHRKVSGLSKEDLKNLYDSIRFVMDESYHSRGMSQTDYVDLDGKEGSYISKLRVYGKKFDPDGNPVKAEKIGQRTTHWVPDLQP